MSFPIPFDIYPDEQQRPKLDQWEYEDEEYD